MDLILTTKCNGNCSMCSNLMQYYHKYNKAYDLDADRIIQNLEKVYPYIQLFSEHDVDELSRWVSIIGGEPFLYRDLPKVCAYLSTQKWWKGFRLWTNASIVPEWMDELLDVLEKDSRFEVIMGDYRWSSKQDEIYNLCKSRGIEVNKRGIEWINYGNPETDCYDKKVWDSCNIRAVVLYGDRLYPCSRIAHMHELGYVNPKRDEYLDIWKDDLSQVENWTQDFTDCCKLCSIGSGDMEEIKAGE